jgi:hypothetical protein
LARGKQGVFSPRINSMYIPLNTYKIKAEMVVKLLIDVDIGFFI